MKRGANPEINAGSMADIAFLLLIFFLVTTTMDVDKGIFRKMAEKNDNPPPIELHEKNLFDVNININDEILIGNNLVNINEITDLAMKFIDNGGGKDINGQVCDWCNGDKRLDLSDHPSKALITISADRNATYETYINVLNSVNRAYNQLRNKLALKLYRTSFTAMEEEFKRTKNQKIFEKIKIIRSKYPLLIGDVETTMASK
ncbi:ExbD/TolR family protein [Tenacibaculum jejuense]|uniref:Biopolymer transport ExbD2 protein n=1 Tax=Tenacibaculum jejuense TaxID=584609 RepID=A0A238UFV4_9FLAO|nr:biopolymer transporter ExbD [Tenacibaculum jejuense]SNR17250.1 Biopolymer transport ExbD2 protein [Tenacibaculum jejuense]